MGAFGAWECPICQEMYQDGDDHKCAVDDLIHRIAELEGENAKLRTCVKAADDLRARAATYRGLTQSMDRYDSARAEVDNG